MLASRHFLHDFLQISQHVPLTFMISQSILQSPTLSVDSSFSILSDFCAARSLQHLGRLPGILRYVSCSRARICITCPFLQADSKLINTWVSCAFQVLHNFRCFSRQFDNNREDSRCFSRKLDFLRTIVTIEMAR